MPDRAAAATNNRKIATKLLEMGHRVLPATSVIIEAARVSGEYQLAAWAETQAASDEEGFRLDLSHLMEHFRF